MFCSVVVNLLVLNCRRSVPVADYCRTNVGVKMEDVDFTDDEISRELADLGYANIPVEQFHQFKKGIENLWFLLVVVHLC